MEDWDRIHDLVLTMKQNLKVPIWAKIRLFPEISQTIEYAKMIEAAGASAIAIHGRTRKQKGNNPGRESLSRPTLLTLACRASKLGFDSRSCETSSGAGDSQRKHQNV